jgi:hypothetical protein
MLADIQHLGSALVLPYPNPEEVRELVPDAEVEQIAMEEALRYERARGWLPEDVSSENRGFDILSRHPEGAQVRFIEVKGRATKGAIVLTANEYKTAERLRGDYWLYAVLDCATKPRLIPIQDPVRLGWEPIVRIEHYSIGPDQLERESADGK